MNEQLLFRNKIGDDLNPRHVRKMVMIIVNAAFRRDRRWDRKSSPPGIIDVAKALGTVPMNRYSFETLELLREKVYQWEWELNHGTPADLAIGDADLTSRKWVEFYIVEVSLDGLRDKDERAYLENLPRPSTFLLKRSTVFAQQLRDC